MACLVPSENDLEHTWRKRLVREGERDHDAKTGCEIAILARADSLPWNAARVCFEHQRDFNYVLPSDLDRSGAVSADGARTWYTAALCECLIRNKLDENPRMSTMATNDTSVARRQNLPAQPSCRE